MTDIDVTALCKRLRAMYRVRWDITSLSLMMSCAFDAADVIEEQEREIGRLKNPRPINSTTTTGD